MSEIIFLESRYLWRQLYSINELWHSGSTIFPIALDPKWGDAYSGETDPQKLLFRYAKYLNNLNAVDAVKAKTLLQQHIDVLVSGQVASKKFSQGMKRIHTKINRLLESLPNTLEKAKGCLIAILDIEDFQYDTEYDIACTFSEYVSEDAVLSVTSTWKRDLRDHLDKHYKRQRSARAVKIHDNYINHIFWVSMTDEEKPDAATRFRFMEQFSLSDFSETKKEIVNLFAVEDLDEYDLWIIQRCPSLLYELQQEVALALKRLAEEFRNEGWLPSRIWNDGTKDFLPSIWRTTIACNAILRLSNDPAKRSIALRGVQWIVSQQHESGAWQDERVRNGRLIHDPSLFVTLIALLTINASGNAGYTTAKTLGERWARGQQNLDGTWPRYGPINELKMTLYWTEYFGRLPVLWHNYQIDTVRLGTETRLYIDDIDSFSAVRSIHPSQISTYLSNGYLDLSEDVVQKGLETILHVQYHKKDWGGELNDLYTANIRYRDQRLQAAFLLKGNGLRSPVMEIKHCGANGDQLLRLFRSSANLFIVQFVGEISENVIADVQDKVNLRRLQGDPAYYCIINGQDTARLLFAYGLL